jgi:hypothetical protein
MKIVQKLFEWEHLGDGVNTTPIMVANALRGLHVIQYQLHTNASVTYTTNLVHRIHGSEAFTINGSVVVDNLDIFVEEAIIFNFSNVAVNESIKIIFVVEDRN